MFDKARFVRWSASISARMMIPLALMLGLVLLLGIIDGVTRRRVREAHALVDRSARTTIALTDVRSLSRSLQRDALNLVIERDPAELAIIQAKLDARSADMRASVSALARDGDFAEARGSDYARGQMAVLHALAASVQAARHGDRHAALAIFRGRVRPNERATSRLADALIAAERTEGDRLRARAGAIERQETVIDLLANVLLFAVTAWASFAISRRTVVRPLSDIEAAMGRVAAGEADGSTPHVDRIDEIGRMARAIEVVRASLREREALQTESAGLRMREMQSRLELERAERAAEERRSARDRAVGGHAATLEGEASEALARLRSSADELSLTSGNLAGHAAAARQQLATSPPRSAAWWRAPPTSRWRPSNS